jgi:addiction module HigA family antidote
MTFARRERCPLFDGKSNGIITLMVVTCFHTEAFLMRMHNPSHPGRLLAYYVQDKSVTEVARHLGVTRPALSRILNGKAGISADMALRISEAFSTDPEFWLRLQAQRDLWVASRKRRAKVRPLTQGAAA